jgi:hypothetical protein
VTFAGSSQSVINGYSGIVAPVGFDATAGFDIRVDSGGTIGTGDILSSINVLTFATTATDMAIRVPHHVTPGVTVPLVPGSRWIRVKVDAAGAEFFTSADGTNWVSAGAPQPCDLPPAAAGGMYLGNSGNSNTAYGGQLNSVQTFSADGATLMQSWVRATQPGALGAGVSPLTGENYPTPVGVTDVAGTPVNNPWTSIPAPPTTAQPGILRANVNGVWEDVASGTATDEVWLGNDPPIDPAVELWYDADAPNVVGAGLPQGGLTDQALTKIDDVDGNAEWSGPHLKLSGGIVTGVLEVKGNKLVLRTADSVVGAVHKVMQAQRLDQSSDGRALFNLDLYQGVQSNGVECEIRWSSGAGGYGIVPWIKSTVASGAAGLYAHGNISYLTSTDRTVAADLEDVAAVEPDLAGQLIDRLKPITFQRRHEGEGPAPTRRKEAGFAVDDFEACNGDLSGLVERLVRPAGSLNSETGEPVDDSERGWSVSGVLAIAVAEIQRLRERVAQLEGGT